MKLIKYSLELPAEYEDIVAASLYECGVEGVEISDSVPLSEEELKSMFVDIPREVEDDGRAILSFYLDREAEESKAVLQRVKEELEDLKKGGFVYDAALMVEDISEVNWQDSWKQYFKAFDIDDIHIVPGWEEYEGDSRDIIIRIDPGSAFGTGQHETTQLCIKEMKKHLGGGDVLLDVGTGSGILGIAALKMGADRIIAVDIDANVTNAVDDNLRSNDIRDTAFELKIGNVAADESLMEALLQNDYDIITANILPDVLKLITPNVTRLMNKDTIYILSGILDIKEAEVREFLEENNLQVISKQALGEWISLSAVLKSAE